MRPGGLPVTLVSGGGPELSAVLVRAPEIGCVPSSAGGPTAARWPPRSLDTGKRHVLEQEGLNAWGIWNFSDWDLLAAHIRKGFEYGKQRCTAYPRFVVQRDLFDEFLDMYLPVVRSVRFGHPLAVGDEGRRRPAARTRLRAADQRRQGQGARRPVDEAVRGGAVPLYRGRSTARRSCPARTPPPTSRRRPARPARTVAGCSTPSRSGRSTPSSWSTPTDELLAAMNACNGALVASLACDDDRRAGKLAVDLQAFKVGINKPRSRGDRDEPFGGRGASWKGAFVGGDLLVRPSPWARRQPALRQLPRLQQLPRHLSAHGRGPLSTLGAHKGHSSGPRRQV